MMQFMGGKPQTQFKLVIPKDLPNKLSMPQPSRVGLTPSNHKPKNLL